MCRLLNGDRIILVGRSMSEFLVTQKGVVIIDIGRLRSEDITHKEIESQWESSFRGSIPMEVVLQDMRRSNSLL